MSQLYNIPHVIEELTFENYKQVLDKLFNTNDEETKKLPKDKVEVQGFLCNLSVLVSSQALVAYC